MVAKRYPRTMRGVWRKSVEWGGADIELYAQYRQYGAEFPCALGPLYSDFKRAFVGHGRVGVAVNRRTLVAAAGRNYGRFRGWWDQSH